MQHLPRDYQAALSTGDAVIRQLREVTGIPTVPQVRKAPSRPRKWFRFLGKPRGYDAALQHSRVVIDRLRCINRKLEEDRYDRGAVGMGIDPVTRAAVREALEDHIRRCEGGKPVI